MYKRQDFTHLANFTDLRSATVNATRTVTDNLVVGSDAAITDITGSGLSIVSNALTVDTDSLGINGAWEEYASNVLTPTNTSAGIFVQASSTIAGSLSVTATTTIDDTTVVVNPNEDEVGINISNADAALHVVESTAGPTAVFRNSSNNYGAVFLRMDNSGQADSRNWGLFTDVNAFGNLVIAPSSNNTSDPTFGNNGLTITNTALTGVATTSPWAQLSVEGQGSGPSLVVSDSSNNTDFIVADDGEVGSGTNDPNADLDVRGSTIFNV